MPPFAPAQQGLQLRPAALTPPAAAPGHSSRDSGSTGT